MGGGGRTCALLTLPLALLLAAGGRAAADSTASSAEFLRRERGLMRVGRGQVWILPLEADVRRRLDRMDRLEERIQAARRSLDERVEQNRQLWPAQRAAVAALLKSLEGLSAGDPQRKPLEAQLQQLKRQAVEPPRLGGLPDVQARLIDLINDQNSLTISYFWLRGRLLDLRSEYRKLAEDPEVLAALRNLGDKSQLGPQRDYQRSLDQFQPLVLTDAVPLYRQSDRWRFCGLVDERMPVTFSWCEQSAATLLTASMAERLGISVSENSPQVPQRLGDRQFKTRRITIPNLRFGRLLLRDVEAYVLPAEAEDVGALLGSDVWRSAAMQLEPERLRLRVAGAGDTSQGP